MDIGKMILELKDELTKMRRYLHTIPETAFQEVETSKFIAKTLSEIDGVEVKTGVAKTGVVGLLKGNGEKTIALRADMDALPVMEENDVEYKSHQKGKMHACGHDAHMSILLGSAMILSKIKDKLRGNVKFIFQPSEESLPGGAMQMIDEDVLENPKVDVILGLHSDPTIETGKVGYKTGELMAFTSEFTILLHGKGGHAAEPHRSIDPIVMASDVIQAIQKISSRWTGPLQPVVVTIGAIHGGTTFNIIPDIVELKGTVRLLNMHLVDLTEKKIHDILETITNLYGGSYEFDFVRGYPVLRNDEKFTLFASNVLLKLLGQDNIIRLQKPLMGGEDFAYYLTKVPGTFLRLGTGNKQKNTTFPWHHSKFNIDEDALPIGVAVFVQCAIDFFKYYE